jgi:hypothetical protein
LFVANALYRKTPVTAKAQLMHNDAIVTKKRKLKLVARCYAIENGVYRVILPCHGHDVGVKTWAGNIFCDECGATYWLRNLDKKLNQ